MINIVKMMQADEGLLYKAYKDTVGKTTVGIGFNMDDAHAKSVWAQADIVEFFDNVYKGLQTLSTKSVGDLFNACVTNAKADLHSIFPTFYSMPDYVQLALINMMFNMGIHVFKEFTQTIDAINKGDYITAASRALQSNWAKQLPERASRVTKLLTGDDSGYSAYTVNIL